MTGRGMVKAAVVGCGGIAYEHLPFLWQSDLVELVGVCDRSVALGRAAAERFGHPAQFSEAEAMLAETHPDIVHVLTPPETHGTLVRTCLAAGSHVVCEKPMTPTFCETAALLKLASTRGLVLQESRNLLYNDQVLVLERAIRNGELGRVIECEVLLSLDFLAGPFGDENLASAPLALPGGAVQDFLPHLAYLFLHLTKVQEVDEVRGVLTNRSGNARAETDYLDAQLQAGEVRGRLRVATDTSPDMFRVVVRGDEATVETDLYNPFVLKEGGKYQGKLAPVGHVANGIRLARDGISSMRAKIMQHGTMHGMTRMLEAIYTSIITRSPPPFSASDMLATAQLIDQIVRLRKSA